MQSRFLNITKKFQNCKKNLNNNFIKNNLHLNIIKIYRILNFMKNIIYMVNIIEKNVISNIQIIDFLNVIKKKEI